MPNIFQKEKFFSNKVQEAPILNNDACYPHNIGQKVIIMTQPCLARGSLCGSHNKGYEPVCLTLSSDDEEPSDESSSSCSDGAASSYSVLLQQCSACECLLNTSQASDGSEMQLRDQSNKSKSLLLETDEEEDEMDVEMTEEEEEEEEEVLETTVDNLNTSVEINRKEAALTILNSEKQMIIPCRSVRIGSFKIRPVGYRPYIAIFMNSEGFRFQVPTVKNVHEMRNISITLNDIELVLGHFGRSLPVLFIFNTPACGERIRKQLHMAKGDIEYFDPEGQDDHQRIITFLINSLEYEHKIFLRCYFPGQRILKEVDLELANKILIKSTPQHNQPSNQQNVLIKNSSSPFIPVTHATHIQNPVSTPVVIQQNVIIKNSSSPNAPVTHETHIQNPVSTPIVIQQNVIKNSSSFTPVTHETHIQNPVSTHVVIQTLPIKLTQTVPQTQVTKVLTYPPPPQTGGIAISSEDLVCLDEGQFLNDVIIDFYLKYLMNEKLSETDRQRTHIFSSFFYPSLIKRLKSGNKALTWTKNVDIFEKDFIIVPLNKDNHWFLAIICFPGLVSESHCSPLKSGEKSTESVTSSNGRKSSESSDLNVQIGGITSLKNNVTTKDQACNTNGQSSGISNEVVSSYMDEPLPEPPDSSTHPDRHAHHNKMPCILIFDSLSNPQRLEIATPLKYYLKMEWDKKGNGTERDFKTAMTVHVTTVPQQTNYSDCGVYVLQYVESFFENPFPYFSDEMPGLPDWFPSEKVASKRKEIKSLILQKRYSSCTATSKESRPNVAREDTEKVLCNTAFSSATLRTSQLMCS